MPRTRLAARLEIVEEQIALTEASIEVQFGAIEEMRRKGYATDGTESHMTILAARLVAHLAERDRLRAELAAAPDAGGSNTG